MHFIRPVGREASSRKYDLLSALMAHGLAGDKHRQRLVLRLMALITTRYNWQRDELTMGQTEIARLWAVDQRTVKRDMARLRELGWIVVKRPGARGRVSVLGISFTNIMRDTQPSWPNIGPDFIARMGSTAGVADNQDDQDTTIVPFRRRQVSTATTDCWANACAFLAQNNPSQFDAWIAPLTDEGIEGGQLILIAPSRFHASYVRTNLMERLVTAVRTVDPSLRGVLLRS